MLLLIFGIGLLANCSDDQDDFSQEKTINGTWSLIKKHGGLASVDIDYPKGDIKWTFKEMDSSLTIENKIGNDHAFLLHSGTYYYDIQQQGESQILFVNNDYRMLILSMEDNLIITDDMNDGFTAEFKK